MNNLTQKFCFNKLIYQYQWGANLSPTSSDRKSCHLWKDAKSLFLCLSQKLPTEFVLQKFSHHQWYHSIGSDKALLVQKGALWRDPFLSISICVFDSSMLSIELLLHPPPRKCNRLLYCASKKNYHLYCNN